MHDRLRQLVTEMVDLGISLEDAQRELARHYVERVLSRAQGNVSKAASALGVHRNTLTRRIRDLRIRVRS